MLHFCAFTAGPSRNIDCIVVGFMWNGIKNKRSSAIDRPSDPLVRGFGLQLETGEVFFMLENWMSVYVYERRGLLSLVGSYFSDTALDVKCDK